MPVLASAAIPIRVNKDHTIEIVLHEIQKSGCACTSKLSEQLGTPLDELKKTVKMLAGEGQISCNTDSTLCCADQEKLAAFVEKLKSARMVAK